MAAVAAKHFSVVDYMQRLKQANFTEAQAETLAKETEDLISNVLEQANNNLDKRELATKQDLQVVKQDFQLALNSSKQDLLISMKEQEIRLIKWVIGTGLATILAIAGLLKFMIH